MIIQIALGILLAAAGIVAFIVAPLFVAPISLLLGLFWFILWRCTREPSAAEEREGATWPWVFGLLVFAVAMVLFLSHAARKRSPAAVEPPTATQPIAEN